MASRSCRYSGFSTLRNPARHQTMNSCPIFSSTESLCRVFSAHLSPRVLAAGIGCTGLVFAFSLAKAGNTAQVWKAKMVTARERDMQETIAEIRPWSLGSGFGVDSLTTSVEQRPTEECDRVEVVCK